MNVQFRQNELNASDYQALRKACAMTLLDKNLLAAALNGSLFTVSAYIEDKLLGTLRVVGDGAFVFLIYDVLVLPEHRSRGIAAALVNRLTLEVLNRGKIPYYGTALSNIASQRTANRAWYVPAWACVWRGRFDGVLTQPTS